jgi:hypothetical protein
MSFSSGQEFGDPAQLVEGTIRFENGTEIGLVQGGFLAGPMLTDVTILNATILYSVQEEEQEEPEIEEIEED